MERPQGGLEARSWLASPRFWACLPVVLAVLLYLPTLGYGTVTDDRPLILNNPILHRPSGALELWSGDIGGEGAESEYYRPLPLLSFWLQIGLSGDDTRALHAGNLLAFALAAALLFDFSRRQWPTLPSQGAALITAAWAAHPLQTEAVIWLSGRFDLFLLLATLGALSFNTRPQRAWTVPLAFLLGLLSKEVAVVLPALVFVQDFEQRREYKKELGKYAALGLALLGYGALRHAAGVHSGGALVRDIGLGLFSSYATLVATFARLLVVPLGLDVHHWYVPLGPWATVGVLLLVTSAAACALCFARRPGHRPGSTLGLGLALVSLVPVALVGPSQHIFGDRFSSLVLLGLAIATPALWPRRATTWLLLTLLCLWAPLQQLRAREWSSEASLREAALSRQPDNPRWRLLQALHLLEHDQVPAAALLFRSLVADQPSYGRAWHLSCIAELRSNRLDAARAACERALVFEPDNPNTWVNSASVLVNQARFGEARRAATRALALRPNYPEAEFLLALALANQDRLDEARVHVGRGLAAAPGHRGLRDLAAQLRLGRAQ